MQIKKDWFELIRNDVNETANVLVSISWIKTVWVNLKHEWNIIDYSKLNGFAQCQMCYDNIPSPGLFLNDCQ